MRYADGPHVALVRTRTPEISPALADVIVEQEAGRTAAELLADWPGASLALVVGSGGTVDAGFRDGSCLTLQVSEPAALTSAVVTKLAEILFSWWCVDQPPDRGGAARAV
jgi:hypothetical protein